jgi:hypothetical protein
LGRWRKWRGQPRLYRLVPVVSFLCFKFKFRKLCTNLNENWCLFAAFDILKIWCRAIWSAGVGNPSAYQGTSCQRLSWCCTYAYLKPTGEDAIRIALPVGPQYFLPNYNKGDCIHI